jgi:hypothetical protein
MKQDCLFVCLLACFICCIEIHSDPCHTLGTIGKALNEKNLSKGDLEIFRPNMQEILKFD